VKVSSNPKKKNKKGALAHVTVCVTPGEPTHSGPNEGTTQKCSQQIKSQREKKRRESTLRDSSIKLKGIRKRMGEKPSGDPPRREEKREGLGEGGVEANRAIGRREKRKTGNRTLKSHLTDHWGLKWPKSRSA